MYVNVKRFVGVMMLASVCVRVCLYVYIFLYFILSKKK